MDSLEVIDGGNNLVTIDDANSGISDVKDKMVKRHYGEERSLVDRISKADGSSIESVINAAIIEIAKESENLLGNELIFTENNNLHDASAVAVKRAEILEKIVTVVGKKMEIMSRSNSVDLNSPVFQVFQQICVDKLKEALGFLDIDNDLKQLIVIKWGDSMVDWEKELKDRVSHLNIRFV